MTNRVRHTKIFSLLIFLVFTGFIFILVHFGPLWTTPVNLTNWKVNPSCSAPEARWRQDDEHGPLSGRFTGYLLHSDRRLVGDHPHQSVVAVAAVPTSLGPTSAETSTVELVSSRILRVGDIVQVRIEARDTAGRRRVTGGDFWYGVLESPDLKAATAGHVIDHENGTYSISFLTGWAGDVSVRVTLVHPSEAVHYLKHSFRHAEKKVLWYGIFMSKNSQERSSCWISRVGNWTNLCEYQTEGALVRYRLLCDPPKNHSCDRLTGLTGATSYKYQFDRVLPRDKAYLFRKNLVNVQLETECETSVIESIDGRSVLRPEQLGIPTCRPDLQRSLYDGFWYGDRWYSLICKPNVRFSRDTLRECFRGTNLYFTGDSTTRQWFAEIAKTLGLSRPEDNQFKNKSFHLARRDEVDDINLEFIFHPLSLHPSAVFVNLSVVRFEVDVLLNLPNSSCNHIIVISPWAHFPNYPWGSYLDWLEGIRAAYLTARERCPQLRLVVKTPHPVNMQWEMKGRDWMFGKMREAMWDTFGGTGATFVDVWNLNLAYPSAPINMHMPNTVVQAEIELLLSHICSR